MRTRVKFCGIRDIETALLAADLGVDAVGLVFYPPSARAIAPNDARRIAAALPPFVTRVGLFLDAAEAEVDAVLNHVPLDLLQFHGREPPAYCRGFSLPYIKSVARGQHAQLARMFDEYEDARGFLLDSNEVGAPGGSGKVFDWQAEVARDRPLILAGGLKAENVAAAIDAFRPFAIDVSSGIESERGIKSHLRMREFMQSFAAGQRGLQEL